MSTAINGPFRGTRTWIPDTGLSRAQVNAATQKMLNEQDWKPLTVIDRGQTTHHQPKKPRKAR